MTLEVEVALIGLAGAVTGGLITGMTSLFGEWRQHRRGLHAEQRAQEAAVEAERRSRGDAAMGRAVDSLSKLLLLGPSPDPHGPIAAVGPRESARGDLVLVVDVASIDVNGDELRERLEEACRTMRLSDGPEKYAHQSETYTRSLAVRHALACIGAYRGGRPLPDRPKEYVDTLALVSIYLEELDANSRR